MKFLVTGGAGFIGSNLVHLLIGAGHKVLNVDKLTYAGCIESLVAVADSPNYQFVQADVSDSSKMSELLGQFRPDILFHLAAESHVDRSIDDPSHFIQSNTVGTFVLLEAARAAIQNKTLPLSFKFIHVSTDEVFGSLPPSGYFNEETAYAPSSPYSASKASADLLVMAWVKTYGFPAIVTNCSNNFGPYQYPEKLIPLMVLRCLEGLTLPIFGSGKQVRDWLYVKDFCEALVLISDQGQIGRSYNVGGNNELTNLHMISKICNIMDEIKPINQKRVEWIEHVQDRPGHDERYAIDATRIRSELGWQPKYDFESSLRSTVEWYLKNHGGWVKSQLNGKYALERLGKLP